MKLLKTGLIFYANTDLPPKTTTCLMKKLSTWQNAPMPSGMDKLGGDAEEWASNAFYMMITPYSSKGRAQVCVVI